MEDKKGYRREVLSILMVTLIVTIVLINTSSFKAKAGPVTSVSVETDDIIEMDVSPDGPGSFSIDGTVTCLSGSPNTVSVQLWVEISVGIAHLDKEEIIFRGGGNQTEFVKIIIDMPEFAQASDKESCTLKGSWQQGGIGENVEPDITTLIIKPFSRPLLHSIEPTHKKDQGDKSYFVMTLVNGGNFQDTYSFEIVNIDELLENGISVDAPSTLKLINGETIELLVKYRIASDANKGVYQVVLHVRGEQSGNRTADFDEQEFTLNLVVKQQTPGDLINSPIPYLLVIIIMIVVFFGKYRKKVKPQ